MRKLLQKFKYEDDSIMKKDLFISICSIALGIIFAIFGFVLEGMIQKKYAGIHSYVSKPSLFEDAGPIMLSFFGVLLVIIGIIALIVALVNSKRPIVEKHGTIVVVMKQFRDFDLLIVEYSDGNRVNLNADKKLCLVVGDSGLIATRGKTIVKFKHTK